MDNISAKTFLTQSSNILQTIDYVSNRFQLNALARQLDAAKNLLNQNSPTDVAILGQFKAGESSFLNSLLGQHVLPVSVIPVTTAITRLQYGETERIVVVRHFDDTKTQAAFATSLNLPQKLKIREIKKCGDCGYRTPIS